VFFNPLKTKTNAKIVLSPIPPPSKRTLAVGSLCSLVLLIRGNVKMILEWSNWWNGTDRGQQKYSEKIPSKSHFVYDI
jgi:hypothetical protein